jgi:autotransporter-associated beta strand protein
LSKIKARASVKFVSAFCAIGFVISSSVYADTLGSWVIPASSTAQSLTSSANAAGTTVSALGFTGTATSSAAGWGGRNFSTLATIGANESKNFNFSITANAGYQIVVNGVSNFSFISSPSGPTTWTLFYSSTADFGSATQIVSISNAGNQTKDITTTLTDALTANPITVRSGTTAHFRLVGTAAVVTTAGNTTSSGTARIPSNTTVSVLGTVGAAQVASLVWNGGSTGNWNYETSNLAWLDGSTPSAFSSGALATISSASALAIAPTGVDAGTLTNSISSGTTTLSGGALTAGTLIKSGNGTLVFSNTVGVNNSINAVNLSGGTLVLQGGGTNRIGTPSLVMVAGSTFDLGDTDQNVTDFNGSGTVIMTNMAPSATDSNRVVPINDFRATPSAPSTFSGQITGTGTFRLGGGTLTLEGNNTYTGQTVMNGTGAILYIWGQSNIPAQTAFNSAQDGEQYATDLRFANSSTLAIMNAPATANNVVLNRSIGVTDPAVTPTFWGGSDTASSLELAEPIKTQGSINIANASSTSYGTVILSGANPTLSNVTVSTFGRLKFSGQTNFGGGTITIPSGTVTPYIALADGSPSNVTITNQLIISTATSRANISVGTYTVTGPLGDGSDDITSNKFLKWNGAISGAGCLLATNPGTLVLGSANSYTGGTQLRGGATLLVSAQNQLPVWTVGSTTSQDADLRFSTGGGTFGLNDSAGPTNVVLINSFWATAEGTFMAGTQTNGSSLTLAGPIKGDANIVASNSVTNAGTLILKGTNSFLGRLQVASRARVYVVEQANIANQIYLSDLTGYGRFGLDASAADSVTLTNAILVGITADNIIGTFNPGTNATTGGNRALHLGGVISGSGRVRVADGGDLCLNNSANTYTNLTRIGTGRILFGSDGALGSTNTNSAAYGGIRFETAANSYLVATNSITLNAGRTILIQSNNTANLDSRGNIFTVAGAVQDEAPGEPGSVNKLGSGEVILSGDLDYSGNTTVSEGKLTLNKINTNNSASTVTIVSNAVLNLVFSGNQTVDKLYLNGVQSAQGTYNSANSGGSITGAGSLVVTSSPPIVSNTAPVITAAQGFSVAENAALATVVGTVAATDADANSTLSGWTIVSGNTGSAFAINAETGQITLAGALNYEATPSYSLGVTVSDGTATSAVGTVVITVTNVSEYSDVFGSSSPTADDNGDGISNLMAYALGATSPSSPVLPPALNTADPTKLTITALIRINDPKVSVVGEYGLTPGTWVTGSPISGVDSIIQTGAVDGVSKKKDFSVDRGTDAKKFMHLKATQAQ